MNYRNLWLILFIGIMPFALCPLQPALCTLQAQVVQVQHVQQLPLTDSIHRVTGKVAGIAPDGRHVLLTDQTNRSLYRYTIRSRKVRRVSGDAGAGYGLKVEKKGLRLQYSYPTLTTMPEPLGPGQGYLWTSVSPNREKYLFYVSGYGAFVCRMDGSELQSIGELHAARWLNDHIIIAMDDHDDGRRITTSSIVAYDLTTGKQQALTDAALCLMYPYADEKGKKIACSSDGGDIYLITLK